MPVEEAAKRGQYGEERYEKVDLQLRVRQQFALLQQADEPAALGDGVRS
jgi:dTMP kinase